MGITKKNTLKTLIQKEIEAKINVNLENEADAKTKVKHWRVRRQNAKVGIRPKYMDQLTRKQCNAIPEMCSERDSPLEHFVLPAPGQPELARLTCGAHLDPPVLTRKQKRPWVNSLAYDRTAAFCAAGPPEVLSRMSRPVTQAAERERDLERVRPELPGACQPVPGEPVPHGFTGRGA